jgi:hypothetical protein
VTALRDRIERLEAQFAPFEPLPYGLIRVIDARRDTPALGDDDIIGVQREREITLRAPGESLDALCRRAADIPRRRGEVPVLLSLYR